jgi:hypothetical protein
MEIVRPILEKFRSVLLAKIQMYFSNNPIRLGGQGVFVHCDETMLNHKVKVIAEEFRIINLCFSTC